MRIAPPARTSSSHTGFVNPFGPHHCAMCLVSVHALNTSSLGASNTRVITRSHSEECFALLISAALTLALFADMFLLLMSRILFLQLPQIIVQSIEALLPELPVVFHPPRNVLQRTSLQPARSPLRFAPARNQPRSLEHLQMLGNRRHAHGERRRQFGDRGLPRSQPRQNRPPRRVRQRSEGRAQLICHICNEPLS